MPTSYPETIWCGGTEVRICPSDVVKAPDATDWSRVVAEVIAMQSHIDATNSGYCCTACHSIGVHEALDGLETVERGDAAVHKTVFELTDVEMVTTDGTTPATDGAWGSTKLYTFPIGHIQILSTSINFKNKKLVAGDGGLSDTADFEIAIGNVAAAQAGQFDLQATEYNLSSAPIDVNLTSGTSDSKESDVNGTPFVIDGSAGAKAVYLNMRTLGNDDHTVVADILTITGEIIINWSYVCEGV